MDIISDRDEVVYRKDFDSKPSYTIRLVRKDKDGNYENGFIMVRFKKDITLKNKTKISIKKAWLDFYKKDNKTYPYIFFSEFNIVEEGKGMQEVQETDDDNPFREFGDSIMAESDISEQFPYDESELPF